jgi:hypothetical protein
VGHVKGLLIRQKSFQNFNKKPIQKIGFLAKEKGVLYETARAPSFV